MGFGAILVNIPFSSVLTQGSTIGAIEWLFDVGINVSEILPLLLFIGIGVLLDFVPLLSNPKLILQVKLHLQLLVVLYYHSLCRRQLMFLKINTEQLLQALDISWKSLVALFVAMLLIYVSINFLSSIKKNKFIN